MGARPCDAGSVTLGALILAGGSARRLSGTPKPLLLLADKPLLVHVARGALGVGADPVVIVGPSEQAEMLRDRTVEALPWTRERPPGGGPVAAIAAGLAILADQPGWSESDDALTLVLAGDGPRVGEVLADLVGAAQAALADGLDGAVCTVDGHDQLLACCVRVDALRDAVGDDVQGRSLYDVVGVLRLAPVAVSANALLDADTWDDLVQLRTMAEEEFMADHANLAAWIDVASNDLNLTDIEVDIDSVLGLARDAAHHVERPAAPLTTYLLGYAAAKGSLSRAEVAELAARLGGLATEFGAAGDEG
jgi:molybdopterin-guanine dinucleotide biosynthesis protein A